MDPSCSARSPNSQKKLPVLSCVGWAAVCSDVVAIKFHMAVVMESLWLGLTSERS